MNFLKEMFAAIAGAFGWATQRSQVHNTEKMQAAAEAAAEVKAVSRVEKEVAVEIDIVFVDAPSPGKAPRIDGVNENERRVVRQV